jgi:hypothetical protein
MSPELQHALVPYATWINAAIDEDALSRTSRPAYLIFASGMTVLPGQEVQIMRRCYRPFRAYEMLVASDSTRRFHLRDLKVGNFSQFLKAEDLPLRDFFGERAPDLMGWPLEVCPFGGDFSVRAIRDKSEDDLGGEFELILLGETV